VKKGTKLGKHRPWLEAAVILGKDRHSTQWFTLIYFPWFWLPSIITVKNINQKIPEIINL
jgi:hypothetical protein